MPKYVTSIFTATQISSGEFTFWINQQADLGYSLHTFLNVHPTLFVAVMELNAGVKRNRKVTGDVEAAS